MIGKNMDVNTIKLKNQIIINLKNLILVFEKLPTVEMIEYLDSVYSQTNIDYLEAINRSIQDKKELLKSLLVDMSSNDDETIFSAIERLRFISRMVDGLGSGDIEAQSRVEILEEIITNLAMKFYNAVIDDTNN